VILARLKFWPCAPARVGLFRRSNRERGSEPPLGWLMVACRRCDPRSPSNGGLFPGYCLSDVRRPTPRRIGAARRRGGIAGRPIVMSRGSLKCCVGETGVDFSSRSLAGEVGGTVGRVERPAIPSGASVGGVRAGPTLRMGSASVAVVGPLVARRQGGRIDARCIYGRLESIRSVAHAYRALACCACLGGRAGQTYPSVRACRDRNRTIVSPRPMQSLFIMR
jgi:hypothetical protein